MRQILPAEGGESQRPLSDGELGSGLPDGENTEMEGYSENDAYPEDDSRQSSREENPWYDLKGLSMWCCCAADLSPMSFLMDSEVTFKED